MQDLAPELACDKDHVNVLFKLKRYLKRKVTYGHRLVAQSSFPRPTDKPSPAGFYSALQKPKLNFLAQSGRELLLQREAKATNIPITCYSITTTLRVDTIVTSFTHQIS